MNKGKNIIVGSLQLVRWCKFNSFQPTKYISYQKYIPHIYLQSREEHEKMQSCKTSDKFKFSSSDLHFALPISQICFCTLNKSPFEHSYGVKLIFNSR